MLGGSREGSVVDKMDVEVIINTTTQRIEVLGHVIIHHNDDKTWASNLPALMDAQLHYLAIASTLIC